MKKFYRTIGGFRKWIFRTMDDWLAIAGSILTSYGIYLIFPPAGLIALGVFLIAASIIWSRGLAGEKHDNE